MKRTGLLLSALLAFTASAGAANWSFWRGPEQIGVSRERDLPDTFSVSPKKPVNILWRAPYGSITTPIVQDGQVYLINKVGEGPTQQERVQAFNATTGKLVWEYAFNVFHTDIVEDRLGFTQMVGDPETGNVYAHGTQGFLLCFSKKGKVLWKHSLTEEFGRVTGYGARITSPVVDEDLVLIGFNNANWGEQTVGGTRFVAFDKRKGDVVWWGSTGHRVRDSYASNPVVAVIGGQRLLVSGGGDGGVHAFKVRTGEKVWSYMFGPGAVNCSPVVQGDRVWIAHGEENSDGTQGRVICLDGAKVTKGAPKLLWQVDGIKDKFASPVLHAGRLYVADVGATLYCLDADTGKQLWDFGYGSNCKGSPLWADGKIYVSEVDSRFHILKPGKASCARLHQVFFRPKEGVPVELHGSPAVADGRVYFTTTRELICIGKKERKPEAARSAPEPAENPAEKGARPAHLQVVPADVALRPGESVALKARAFDDHGRLLGEVKVDWSLAGPRPPVFPIGFPPQPKPAKPPATPPPLAGELSAKSGTSTKLTVPRARNGQFGRVVAKLGRLTGEARVRVAPVPPYTQDFDKLPDGSVPGGWANTQGKFAVARLKDGSKALRKRNDNPSPPLARANAYIGLPDLHDYTIQADVMGKQKGKDLPEMGVGANRYNLVLIGNDQELRLVTWDAQKRIEKKVPFPWKSGEWYRMKFTVEVHGDKGIARGKVWARGESEPQKWTIEAEDPRPNKEGSPSLYGWAIGAADAKNPGTEIYYDNVKITPNK
jgi:outer membrane protein assembly factor BamB